MDIEGVMVMDTVAATGMAADLQRAAAAVSAVEHAVAVGTAAVIVNRDSFFRIDTESLHLPVEVAPLKAEQL